MRFNLTDNLNPLLSFLSSSKGDNKLKGHIYDTLQNLIYITKINDVNEFTRVVRNSNNILNSVLKYLLSRQGNSEEFKVLTGVRLLKSIMHTGIIFDENPSEQFVVLINNLSKTITMINNIRHNKKFYLQRDLFKTYAMTYVNTIFMILTLILEEYESGENYINQQAQEFQDDDPINFVNSDEPPYE